MDLKEVKSSDSLVKFGTSFLSLEWVKGMHSRFVVNCTGYVLLGAGYGQGGLPQAGYGKPPSQPGYDSAGGYGMQSGYGADAGGSEYGQPGGGRGGGGMTHHSRSTLYYLNTGF